MEGKIIKISDYKFKFNERDEKCAHRRVTLNDNGHHVECGDCGKQLSAFWVLKSMITHIQEAWDGIMEAEERLNEQYKEKRFLRILNILDKAWRPKRQMAVACPHCQSAILPEDDLGQIQTSAELERRRRKLNSTKEKNGSTNQ